ncbi:hypothetical protein AALA82_10685 [Oscillospiraceae bacterium 50-16]
MSWRYEELFEADDKVKCFNEIAEQFYHGNFGKMSKADFEVLLFHLYIEQCLEKKLPFDDYTLSRDLGITQSRIRTLKIKKELQYPHDGFEWKEAFVAYIPNAYYDSTKHLVKVHIPDVSVLMELRNHIETHGWYDEYQLNPKLFQCKTDVFIKLCRSLDQEEDLVLSDESKEALRKLQREAKGEKEQNALERILSGSVEDGLKEIAISASKELLMFILGQLPFGGIAASAIQAFMPILEKS